MPDNVIRICDHERKSREPDAVAPRDPCDATIIILPTEQWRRSGELIDRKKSS